MLVSILTLSILGSALASPISQRSAAAPSVLSGTHGAVATEVAECSQAGVDILKAGGSAADAMVAASLCVGVFAAYHSGIGGGGFGIVRFNNGSNHGYEMIE